MTRITHFWSMAALASRPSRVASFGAMLVPRLLQNFQSRSMTRNRPQDRSQQVLDEAKIQWGQLTPDDLNRIVEGDLESLVILLQERYGYDRARAEKEVEHFQNRLSAHIYLRYRFP